MPTKSPARQPHGQRRPLIKIVKGMVAVTFLGGCRLGEPIPRFEASPDAGDAGHDAGDAGHDAGDAGHDAGDEAGFGDAGLGDAGVVDAGDAG